MFQKAFAAEWNVKLYQRRPAASIQKNISLQYNLQHICAQAGENGQDFIKRGRVERDWIGRWDHHGNEDLRGVEHEGNVGGNFMLKWSKVGGNRSSLFFFLRFWEILMAAVQALTVMNSSHTHIHTHSTHTRAHTHTHHYITDNNSYITRPCGHWGNYNELTSVPAGQINTNTEKFMFPDGKTKNVNKHKLK